MFFSQHSFAADRCSDIFETSESTTVDFSNEHQLMLELKQTREVMARTTGQREFNDSLHNIVVTANQMMRQAVDFIIQINAMNLSPQVVAQKSEMAERLIEELQVTFGIGDNSMKAAVSNRVNNDVAELQANYQAMQQRQAIGFGRNESSESFHSEVVPRRPAGFRTSKPESEGDTATKETVPLGFQPKNKQRLEESIDEIVEYAEVESNYQIGFRPIAEQPSGAGATRHPVGFRSARYESDKISEATSSQISFDVETGWFEINVPKH